MENNFESGKANDTGAALADTGASTNNESIVNVLAILSDGKTRMRGPSGTGFIVDYDKAEQCTVATSLHAIIPDSRAPLASIEVTGADGKNPGDGYLRVAMVQPYDTTTEALHRLVNELDKTGK